MQIKYCISKSEFRSLAVFRVFVGVSRADIYFEIGLIVQIINHRDYLVIITIRIKTVLWLQVYSLAKVRDLVDW